MTFHYAGKFNGDEDSLPQREHPEHAVQFREPTMKQMAVGANLGAFLTMLVLAVPYAILGRDHFGFSVSIGAIMAVVAAVPHEYLHALCFRGDVYMYTNLKQGMLFVTGTEDMSRRRFVLMSLCPNLIFGFFPYLLFLCFSHLTGLGAFGLLSIGMGFGDYINVFNAMTQVPKEATVYLSGFHSFWYLPQSSVKE